MPASTKSRNASALTPPWPMAWMNSSTVSSTRPANSVMPASIASGEGGDPGASAGLELQRFLDQPVDGDLAGVAGRAEEVEEARALLDLPFGDDAVVDPRDGAKSDCAAAGAAARGPTLQAGQRRGRHPVAEGWSVVTRLVLACTASPEGPAVSVSAEGHREGEIGHRRDGSRGREVPRERKIEPDALVLVAHAERRVDEASPRSRCSASRWRNSSSR
jgi:hypothetical protein